MHNLNRRKMLFIDHESGHGGSSISLYNKIKLISNKSYEISIILREKSYLEKKYKKMNVKVHYLKIPTITSLANLSSNILYSIKFFFKFIIFNIKNKSFYKSLSDFDNIHLNHENLYWLLREIKLRTNIKVSVSIRTILKKSFFSKLQSNIINNYADKKLFISKINQKKFNELTKIKKKNNFILENFYLKKTKNTKFIKNKSFKKIFNIISLSNYSNDRGLDRIVNIAKIIENEKIKNIKFIFLGDYKIKSFKNLFSNKEKYNLKVLVKKNYLKNVKILGHKKNIIRFLNDANLLLYLPRTDSSWGRNIIESLCNGVPVIASGKTNTLIKNGINGYFLKKYNKNKIFNLIKKLYYDRNKLAKMSVKAKNIALKKYQKKEITQKLIDIIEN